MSLKFIVFLFPFLLVGFNNCSEMKLSEKAFQQLESDFEEPADPQEDEPVEESLELWPEDAKAFKVEVSADQSTFHGLPLAEIKGIVVCFHGTGGSGQSWFSQFLVDAEEESSKDMGKLEASLWTYKALKSGLIVVAPTSLDRANKQWQTSTNPNAPTDDVLNVRAYLEQLKTDLNLPDSLPQFSIGMSNGGGFAPYFAFWEDFDRVAVHSSPGGIAQFSIYNIPTIWIRGLQDSVINHQNTENNLGSLRSRIGSGNVPVHYFERRSLQESDFLIEKELYAHLISLLKDNNLLDEDHVLNFPMVDTSVDKFAQMNLKKDVLQDILAEDPQLGTLFGYLQERLLLLDGEHRFTSQFFPETIEFFLDQDLVSQN